MADLTPEDWKALVREQVHPLDLPEDLSEEVITELAAHLEDLYEEQSAQGTSASEAQQAALNEIANPHALARNIQRAKHAEETMNDRIKHLWLPGLVSIVAALVLPSLLVAAATHLGLNHAVFSERHPALAFFFLIYAGWALSGGVGAFLSRQTGGGRLARLVSGLFPVALILASIFEQIFDTMDPWPLLALGSGRLRLLTFGQAAALVLGAMPFLVRRRHTHSEVNHA